MANTTNQTDFGTTAKITEFATEHFLIPGCCLISCVLLHLLFQWCIKRTHPGTFAQWAIKIADGAVIGCALLHFLVLIGSGTYKCIRNLF